MPSSILIYVDKEKHIHTEVKLEDETVWLSQKQMSELFATSADNIGLHLKNIFADGELSEKATTEDYSVVQLEGKRKVNRRVKHYNLDAIISVGYRVNSKKGTQFRIWANKVLREYLVQGYALDQARLQKQKREIQALEKTVALFQQAQSKALNHPEAMGLLSALTDYTHSFVLLNQYDTGEFPEGGLNTNITTEIKLSDATTAITELKKRLIQQGEATELFGQTKDKGFAGILGNIVQSFGLVFTAK